MANDEIGGFFSEKMAWRMSELGMSLNDLSEKSRYCYEMIRRIYKGEALPSRHAAAQIGKALELDPDDMVQRAMWDSLRRRSVEAFWQMQGGDPRMDKMHILVEYLSDDDVAQLLRFAEIKAQMNREGRQR